MRFLTFLCITLALTLGVLFAYDRLRTRQTANSRPAAWSSAIMGRIERMEGRVRALRADVSRPGSPGAAASASRSVDDGRLHDAPPVHVAEETIARWTKGLEALEAKRLREDEHRYVERRLGELQLELEADELRAATHVVVTYLRTKANAWQGMQVRPRDPHTAQEIYDGITQAHHDALAKVVKDPRKVQRIADALMPFR